MERRFRRADDRIHDLHHPEFATVQVRREDRALQESPSLFVQLIIVRVAQAHQSLEPLEPLLCQFRRGPLDRRVEFECPWLLLLGQGSRLAYGKPHLRLHAKDPAPDRMADDVCAVSSVVCLHRVPPVCLTRRVSVVSGRGSVITEKRELL